MAVGRSERQKIAGSIRSEEQMARRGQDTRATKAFTACSLPSNFSRLIVQSQQDRVRDQWNSTAALMVSGTTAMAEIPDAITAPCVEVEQAGLRIKAGRHPTGASVLRKFDERAVQLRFLGRIWHGTSFGIHTHRPVRRAERDGQQMLARHAVEHKEVPIAACLRQQLAWFSVERRIE